MASMIKSGIRLYNHNPRAINFATSRLGASANPYRSLCSSSNSDGQSMRTFNVDTCSMVKALKAEGIPLGKAEAITNSITEILAELHKNPAHPCSTLLKAKFESLQKNIKFDKGAQETSKTENMDSSSALVPVVGIIAIASIVWKIVDKMP